jgi:hypothetical protein
LRDRIFMLAATFLFAAVLMAAAFVSAGDAPNPPDIHRQFILKTTDADAPIDVAVALAVDAEGNAFVTGYSLVEQRLIPADDDDDTVNDDADDDANADDDADDDEAEPVYEYDYDWVTVMWGPGGLKPWAARHAGQSDEGLTDDKARDIAVDARGNIFVTGAAYSVEGGKDIVTVKYNTDGERCWVASFDGPLHGADQGNAITVDAGGNVYVTGFASVFDEQFGISTQDVATIKYDADGNRLWFAFYSFGVVDHGNRIAVDSNGNVLVSGVATTFMMTLRYDPDGRLDWVSQYFGDESGNGAVGLAVDAAGAAFVAGASWNEEEQNFDFTTIKYSSFGADEWANIFSADAGSRDLPLDLALDTQGRLYVTGCSGVLAGDPDYMTIKYDAGGAEMWRSRYAGPVGSDCSMAIALDSANRPVVTGSSLQRYVIEQDYDIATVKYDVAGQREWVARYDGPDGLVDLGEAVVVDGNDDILVAATSVARVTGPDIVLVKYDREGDELWVGRHNGPGEFPADAPCLETDDDDLNDDAANDDVDDDDDSIDATDDDDDDNDDGACCG